MTKGKRRFHRLSTKFICGTAAILALILAATLFVNSKVAARYYLRQQTAYVSQAGSRIREYLDAGMSPDEAVASLAMLRFLLPAIHFALTARQMDH